VTMWTVSVTRSIFMTRCRGRWCGRSWLWPRRRTPACRRVAAGTSRWVVDPVAHAGLSESDAHELEVPDVYCALRVDLGQPGDCCHRVFSFLRRGRERRPASGAPWQRLLPLGSDVVIQLELVGMRALLDRI